MLRLILWIFGALAVLYLIGPMVVIVIMSFTSAAILNFPPDGFSLRWYEHVLSSSMWMQSALTSVEVALMVTVLATILGTLAAFGIVRGNFPAKNVLNAFFLMPLIVPLVIYSIAIFAVFTQWNLTGSKPSLVLAHTVGAIPLVLLNVSVSLRSVDPDLERAARNLGAGAIRTFWRVTLPLITRGIVAGAIFAFLSSWDEVIVAIFLTSPTFRTLPIVIWTQVQDYIDPSVAAVSGLLTLFTIACFVLVYAVQRVRVIGRKGTW